MLAPPTVHRGPQDTEVIEGDGLDLPCEVSLFAFNAHKIYKQTVKNESEFQSSFFSVDWGSVANC